MNTSFTAQRGLQRSGWLQRYMLGAAVAAAAVLMAFPAQAAKAPAPKVLSVAVSPNLYPGATLSYTVSVTNPTASTWTITATASGSKWKATFPTLTVAVGAGTSVVTSAPSSVVTIPATFHGKATLKVTAKSGTTSAGSLSSAFVVGDVVANFTATPTSGTLPLTVQFTDTSTTSSSITSWLWTFGDGSTSTLRNPSHQYISYGTGVYSVSLRAQGPNGVNTKMNLNYITVRPPLPVNPPATGVSVQLTAPTNGTCFVAGERAWVLVTLNDASGNALTPSQLSSLSLYMFGPQEQSLTKAACALLGATTDRSASVHHYINLLTSPSTIVNGNVVAFQLNPVTTEEPGTYTVTVRGALAADALQQWMPLTNCQIRTAVKETEIVAKENCGDCHYGPTSGKYYMHHIETSSRSPTGSPSYESWPVRTCKACHNQDGYAAYTDPVTGTKVSDAIITRVHGIHMGAELKSPANTGNWLIITNATGSFSAGNTVTGNTSLATAVIELVDTNKKFLVVGEITGTFSANETITSGGATAKCLSKRSGLFLEYYLEGREVEFPKGPKDCQACHIDDRWKTAPSRLACGTCHDNVWFGNHSATPQGMINHPTVVSSNYAGMAESAYCLVCHDGVGAEGLGVPSIEEAHDRGAHPNPLNLGMNAIDVTLTPPANGRFYAAGDTPKVTLVIKDDNGNALTNHTMVNTTWFSTASLFVYGPRRNSMPVLTSMANLGLDAASRPSVTCANAQNWPGIPGQTFKIAVNGSAPTNIVINAGVTNAAKFVAQLAPILSNLCSSGIAGSGAVVTVSSGKVKIQSRVRGANARIEIYNGPVTTDMGWKAAGVTLEPDVTTSAISTPANNLLGASDPLLDYVDPNITKTTNNITYQLSDVAGLEAGTYFVYALDVPKSNLLANYANPCGIGFINFQVGKTNADKTVATCLDCHGDTVFHLDWGHPHPAPFDSDACKACHDYGHPNTGDMFKNQGGTSLNGWSGFGAMPISRRVHGVHYAHYLEHSEEIYANATPDTFSWIIFPQDVRNCTKCHAGNDTWKQAPSRVACLGCHDSDAAKAHGKIMTYMPDPGDPYGADAEESCEACHGDDTDFSPDKVHSISNPYVPPYPRN